MTEYSKDSEIYVLTEDDETPPNGWQPSKELLEKMNSAPVLDLDLHLGGETESIEGLNWLAKREADRMVEENWDDETTLKSAGVSEHHGYKFTFDNYPGTYGYILGLIILFLIFTSIMVLHHR
jgi:hypothetical protein